LSGILQLRIGVNCVETEEWSNGETALKEAIAFLRPLGDVDPISLLEAQNQMGVLWANRSGAWFIYCPRLVCSFLLFFDIQITSAP
jgi:hypothetical protein